MAQGLEENAPVAGSLSLDGSMNVPRHKENLQPRADMSGAQHELHSVDSRHHDIGEEQVDIFRMEGVKRVDGVRRGVYSEALRVQHDMHEIAQVGLVFDEQDVQRRFDRPGALFI